MSTYMGMAFPLYPDTDVTIEPFADDKVLTIGNSGATQYSMDIKWEGNSASGADYLYFDASANLIYSTGVDLQFKDSDLLVFGTGAGASGDVNIKWDGTNLLISAVADNSLIEFGDASSTQLSFDLKWYGSSASGADVLFADASANLVSLDGIDFQLKDADILEFGDATGGDVYMRWDAQDFDVLAAADNTVFKFGNATNTFDIHLLGSTAGARVVWDSSLNALHLNASAQNARTYLNMGTLAVAPTTGVAIGDMFVKRTGTAYRLGIIVTGTTKKYMKFSLTVGG